MMIKEQPMNKEIYDKIKNPYVMVGVEGFTPTVEEIITAVCTECNVREDSLDKKNGRWQSITVTRQLCWKLIKKYHPHISLGQIGTHFGGYHHSNILDGINRVSGRIEMEDYMEILYELILKRISKIEK